MIKMYLFQQKINKITQTQAKYNRRRKSMQEKETTMAVRALWGLPNSYPRDGIFKPRLTTIKDSYSLCMKLINKI